MYGPSSTPGGAPGARGGSMVARGGFGGVSTLTILLRKVTI